MGRVNTKSPFLPLDSSFSCFSLKKTYKSTVKFALTPSAPVIDMPKIAGPKRLILNLEELNLSQGEANLLRFPFLTKNHQFQKMFSRAEIKMNIEMVHSIKEVQPSPNNFQFLKLNLKQRLENENDA